MIFFNISEARSQLLTHGIVYTLRSATRAVGRTKAVTGNRKKHEVIAEVEITRMGQVGDDELKLYVTLSGFKSAEEWLKAASLTARTLYRVMDLNSKFAQREREASNSGEAMCMD